MSTLHCAVSVFQSADAKVVKLSVYLDPQHAMVDKAARGQLFRLATKPSDASHWRPNEAAWGTYNDSFTDSGQRCVRAAA